MGTRSTDHGPESQQPKGCSEDRQSVLTNLNKAEKQDLWTPEVSLLKFFNVDPEQSLSTSDLNP